MQLKFLSNQELLIAAGLQAKSTHRNEWFYFAWVCYAKELKRRRLTWPQAKAAAKDMEQETGYPRKGWEKKYIKRYGDPAVANIRREPPPAE